MKIAVYHCAHMNSKVEGIISEMKLAQNCVQLMLNKYSFAVESLDTYFDVGGGAQISDRQNLCCLLDACKSGEYDTVVFVKGAGSLENEQQVTQVTEILQSLHIDMQEMYART